MAKHEPLRMCRKNASHMKLRFVTTHGVTRFSSSRQCPKLTQGKQIGFGNIRIDVRFGEAQSI